MDSKNKKYSFKARFNSFKYAFSGLKILIKDEHNARIHFVISVVVCLLGVILNISLAEWIAVLILIALVVGMEIINSAIERICDFISPNWDKQIKQIKDLTSAAVLLSSFIAVICGIIIFLPKLYALIFS